MRPWQFSKPKNPGFGIARGFYLTVLASRAVLPSLLEIVNPQGSGGAIEGLGAPLSPESSKEALALPLARGAYAIATKDRKTVLKTLVINRDEAGFDPEAFAQSSLALTADPELLARVRATWTLVQLMFESHDAMVYPAADFLLKVAARLAELSDGVVGDSIAQRYLLPEAVFHQPRLDPRIDARDHVVADFVLKPDGLHAFTRGLQKFALPELEILSVGESDQEIAARFLLVLSQTILLGDLVKNGERFGSNRMPFEAREGGFDRAMWEGIPVLELLPPTSATSSEALHEWAKDTGLAVS